MSDTTHTKPAAYPNATKRGWRRIGRPAAAALATLTLCLALVTVAGLRTSDEAREAEQWVAHTLEVLTEVREALSAVQDAETGQRGYLLTRQPDYLQPFEEGLVAAPERLRRTRELTSDNPAQQQRLIELETAVSDKLAELGRTVDLGSRGDFDAAMAVVRTDEGQRIMQTIRRLFLEVSEEEQRLLVIRQAQAAAVARQLALNLYSAAGLALITTLACFAAVIIEVRQQRREQALVDRGAAQLRNALENTSDGVYTLGPDGRFAFLNQHATEQLAGGRDLIGRLFSDVIPEGSDQRVWHAHWVCIKERVPTEIELHHEALGRQFVLRAFPVIEGGIAVFFRDVTEERTAVSELAASEARLRTILETVPVGLIMAELPSGRIVGGNRYVEQMLRHPVLHSPDIHGYDEWVSFHADGTRVNGHEYPLARMVMAGEENPSIDVHYQRGDGSRAWTRIAGRPVRNERDEVVGGVVALVDIDAARRAQEALTASEARLKDLLATLDLGTFMARDLDGVIRFWSKGCERLYGWTAEEAIGRVSHDLLRTVFPVPLAEVQAALERDGCWTGDLLHHTRDGREVIAAARKVLRPATADQPGAVLEVLADVTAQRRAEAALAASEERLRLASESTGLAIWDADLATGTATWTANQFEMLGYVPDPFGRASNAMWRDRILPEDWPEVEEANRRGRAGEQAFRIVYRIRRADTGAERWIETVGRYLDHGPDGTPRRVLGVGFDVTDRRDAGAALAESEARLRSIVDTAADGILVADAAGGVVLANPAALRIFGYDGEPDGLLGQNLELLMPAAEAARHGGYLAAHRATGKARVIGVPGRSLMGRRRDGTEFPIDLSVGSFEVGGERFFTGVVRDVSQRVAAEATLVASAARFRALAEAIPSLLYEADAQGRSIYVNPRFTEYTGLPLEEAAGQGWRDAMHPDDRSRAVESWMAAVRTGQPYENEYRLQRQDGLFRWFLARSMPVRDAEGRILRWVGTCTDIDDQKRAEAGARESEARLQLALEAGGMGFWS
ncbi:PAS domain S-box protein [Paracraurococcus lichenis]|uniref:histidine kinase n=1 Tax=Paracraurococcus lichenis TaxID=3064888 RepID=A0ABT9E7W8_9PROT|nr:PAS domain S-box protein [Paracraurococcus sp. LOR1-02]MDO9712212.1 PAS domain S-box protein [Paracraurococcus sp. LOR1-02]